MDGTVTHRTDTSPLCVRFPIFSVNTVEEALLLETYICCERPGEPHFYFPGFTDQAFRDLYDRAVFAFVDAYEKFWPNSAGEPG